MCVCVCECKSVCVCACLCVRACVCLRVRGTQSPNKAGIIGAGHSPLYPHQTLSTSEHQSTKLYPHQTLSTSEHQTLSNIRAPEHQTLSTPVLVLVNTSQQEKNFINTKHRSTHSAGSTCQFGAINWRILLLKRRVPFTQNVRAPGPRKGTA